VNTLGDKTRQDSLVSHPCRRCEQAIIIQLFLAQLAELIK